MVNPSSFIKQLPEEKIVYVERLAKDARIKLHRGTPDIAPPEWLKADIPKSFQYTSPSGDDGLREAIVDHYNSRINSEITRENVSVTVGSSDALLKLCLYFFRKSPGIILMPEIMWTIPESQVKFFTEGTPVFYKLKNNLPDLGDLEDKIGRLTSNGHEVKLVYINYPHNPTGKMLDEMTAKELARLSKEKDFAIISDEVYHELYFDRKPISMLDYAEDRTFVVNSASKIFGMTGEREGYIITRFPGAIKVFYNLMRASNVCPPSIGQDLFRQALIDPRKDEYINKVRETYRKRRDVTIEEFSKTDKLKFEIPEGSFYLWVDTGVDGEVVMNELLKLGVSVTPGKFFAYKTLEESLDYEVGSHSKNFLRISLTVPDEYVKEGAEIIVDYIEQLYK